MPDAVQGGREPISPVQLESVLTCPVCGYAERKVMPTDACLFFHQCAHCLSLLRPNAGDCCVFCSFGSLRCPPRQTEGGCSSFSG